MSFGSGEVVVVLLLLLLSSCKLSYLLLLLFSSLIDVCSWFWLFFFCIVFRKPKDYHLNKLMIFIKTVPSWDLIDTVDKSYQMKLKASREETWVVWMKNLLKWEMINLKRFKSTHPTGKNKPKQPQHPIHHPHHQKKNLLDFFTKAKTMTRKKKLKKLKKLKKKKHQINPCRREKRNDHKKKHQNLCISVACFFSFFFVFSLYSMDETVLSSRRPSSLSSPKPKHTQEQQGLFLSLSVFIELSGFSQKTLNSMLVLFFDSS